MNTRTAITYLRQTAASCIALAVAIACADVTGPDDLGTAAGSWRASLYPGHSFDMTLAEPLSGTITGNAVERQPGIPEIVGFPDSIVTYYVVEGTVRDHRIELQFIDTTLSLPGEPDFVAYIFRGTVRTRTMPGELSLPPLPGFPSYPSIPLSFLRKE